MSVSYKLEMANRNARIAGICRSVPKHFRDLLIDKARRGYLCENREPQSRNLNAPEFTVGRNFDLNIERACAENLSEILMNVAQH